MKFSTQNKWHERQYTYEVHENCSILKTPHLLVQLRPHFFHSLDLGRPISSESSLSPNDNQSIKRKHNPRMTIIWYQAFPSGRFSFSVSTHYLVWLPIDFFSFNWSQSRPQSNLKKLKTCFSPFSYSKKIHWGQGSAETSLSTFLWP